MKAKYANPSSEFVLCIQPIQVSGHTLRAVSNQHTHTANRGQSSGQPFTEVPGETLRVKGIVHVKINFWYVLAYLKGIQDVGVFVSAVVSILVFLGQTVFVCQSYNEGQWSPPQRACTEKSKLNMI